MTFSISSLMISLGMVLLLTLALYFILWSKRSLKAIRIDFIIVLFSMIFFRLLLPIEFPTAITLRSGFILPAIHEYLYRIFSIGDFSVSILNILCLVWIIGVLIKIMIVVKEHLALLKVVNVFDYDVAFTKSIHKRVIRVINDEKIQVVQSDAVPSIVTVGVIHPKILLPNIPGLTPIEMNYILAHEIQHIKNKDIFIKYLLEVLVSVYWWFPPIYLLRKQLELILEMRVDAQVTKFLDDENYFGYAQSLVTVSKKMLHDRRVKVGFSRSKVVNFIPDSSSILEKRIDFLLDGFEVRKTKRLILMLLFIIPFFFLGVIFEPYSESNDNLNKTVGIEDISDGYILKTKEGRFYYYNNEENLGEIFDVNELMIKDLPILEE